MRVAQPLPMALWLPFLVALSSIMVVPWSNLCSRGEHAEGRFSSAHVLRHTRPAGSIYERACRGGLSAFLRRTRFLHFRPNPTIDRDTSIDPKRPEARWLRCRQFLAVGLHQAGTLIWTAYLLVQVYLVVAGIVATELSCGTMLT